METYRIDGIDGNGCAMNADVIEKTYRKYLELTETDPGFTTIINKNWRFQGRGYSRVIKLVQTNDRRSGKPKHIVWVCWK